MSIRALIKISVLSVRGAAVSVRGHEIDAHWGTHNDVGGQLPIREDSRRRVSQKSDSKKPSLYSSQVQ